MGSSNTGGEFGEPLRREDDLLLGIAMRYLDGELSERETVAFEKALIGSRQRRRVVAQLAFERELLREVAQPLAVERDALIEAANEDSGVFLSVIDMALESRRLGELEARANQRLQADQAESKRLDQFERRRAAADHSAKGPYTLVVPVWAVLLGAAAIGLAVVLAVSGVFDPPSAPVADRTPGAPAHVPGVGGGDALGSVGMVDATVDARWARGAQPIGGELFPGNYQLDAGLVRLSYDNGVSVVLEGPARFEVHDSMNLALHLGGVSATVTRAAGRGFRVQVPGLEVVEGEGEGEREYGVVARADGTAEAHVYRGDAVVQALSAGRAKGASMALVAGEGVRMGGLGSWLSAIPAVPLAVVRDDEFEVRQRVALGEAEGYDRWLAYSYRLRRDPAVMAYYAFEQADEDTGRLNNVAVATGEGLDGVLGGEGSAAPRWVRGRFPEKRGLEFDREQSTRVVVADDDRLNPVDAVTIACWINRAGQGDNSGVFVSRFESAQRIAYQFGGFPGHSPITPRCLQFATGVVEIGACESSAPVLQPTDQWEHIAVSYDGRAVRFYHDGRFISESTLPVPLASCAADLVIGGQPASVPAWMDNPFGGVMDELVLMSRAMTAREIEEMYLQGRPGDDPGGS